DLVAAVQAQNNVNPSGRLGAPPAPAGQQFTYTVRAPGRLLKAEEFCDVVPRLDPDGPTVPVRGGARVAPGGPTYTRDALVHGEARGHLRSLPDAGFERPRCRQRRKDGNGRAEETIPDRCRVRYWVGHHAAGHRGDPRDPDHSARDHATGGLRGLHVSAELA